LVSLAQPRQVDCERNEVAWWSNWADVAWFGSGAWLMTTSKFPEYFLNRGGILDCKSARRLNDIEESMIRRRLVPHFFIQEGCKETIRSMLGSGYERVDDMAVMTPMAPRLHEIESLRVEAATGVGADEWARTYLRSFYPDLSLLPAVKGTLRAMQGVRQKTLLLGRIGGEAAGVLALFRTPGLLGVYCVGTVPEFRGRGVAASMLSAAQRTGDSERRQMILQTIRSDGYEPYYTARGFKRLYTKALLRKDRHHSRETHA